jgi:hypothetical protein
MYSFNLLTVIKENNSTSDARNGTWALCPSLLMKTRNPFTVKTI